MLIHAASCRFMADTAEQEQCFSEVDCSGVDGAEALVELAAVTVRIDAGDVEKGLRDRQRGAQLVGSVGVGDSGQGGRACGRRGSTLPADRTPAGTPARWPRSARNRAGGRRL